MNFFLQKLELLGKFLLLIRVLLVWLGFLVLSILIEPQIEVVSLAVCGEIVRPSDAVFHRSERLANSLIIRFLIRPRKLSHKFRFILLRTLCLLVLLGV